MTLDQSVHGMRLRVIERAQVQGNVSAVCRELGISRTVFYRWRQRLERYGVDGVHPRRQRAQAGRPVATAPEVERLVLAIAISAATWGCRRIAAYLTRTWRVRLAPSTVQRLLRRVGLATRRARLTVLEQQAARTAGLLTERTRQRLWRARYGRTRHVEAKEPKSGRSRRAMRPLRTGWPACCPPTMRWPQPRSCARWSSPTTSARGARCAASSPMAGPSSRGRLMRAAAGSASGTRAPNRAMPGP